MGTPDNVINIRELNVDLIPPITAKMDDPSHGGSKIVVIGKPGTGKTTLITSLLYEKKHIFPIAMAQSGTEDSNGHYRKIFPSSFVYNKLEEGRVEDFVKRQKIAKKHLPNPWAILLLDDCTDDPKLFNKPLFQGLYKNGRLMIVLMIQSYLISLYFKDCIKMDGIGKCGLYYHYSIVWTSNQ
jgi:hypothetical protein